MIVGHNVSVWAPNGRKLLKGINFKIKEGEILVFCGPNGCGKSTLLRSIAGLEENTSGIMRNISVDQISYIPTRPLDLLLPWTNVKKNIEFFLNIAINRGIIFPPIVIDYGAHLGLCLEIFANRNVYQLSSGQQAVLAIYCGLIQKPKLIIADEVFSTLTENLRLSVASFLKQSKVSMLCASHDNKFIEALGAKRIQLDGYVINE